MRAFLLLPLLSLSVVFAASAKAETLRESAARLIREAGYWCDVAADVTPDPFGQTANTMAFRVMCDDGTQVANYDLTIDKNSGRVGVEEVTW